MAVETMQFNNASFLLATGTSGVGTTATLNGTLAITYDANENITAISGSLSDSSGNTYSGFTVTSSSGASNYMITASNHAAVGATGYDLIIIYPFIGTTTTPAPQTVDVKSQTLNALGTPVTTQDNPSVPVSSNTACFGAGTFILTSTGEVSIESLSVGDRVVTMSGAQREIRWLGHRTVQCRRHPRPGEVMPIRISAHAFSVDRPKRDLYVSPGHAICVDVVGEVLIPAFALVNGSTIQQVEVDAVTYWHVELDSHDVLLTENMPAESYLDMGNRDFFAENGVVALDASPDALVPTHADFCRPFLMNGRLVEVVRAQLSARAREMGWRLEAQGLEDLHLLVDGIRVEPQVRGFVARFELPAEARDVWIVSPTNIPAVVADSPDLRALGACLTGLAIDDGFGACRTIAVDDPRLCVGFHAVESDAAATWRWTAGRARLPASLWADSESDFFLRVNLAGPMLPRWVAPAAKAPADSLVALAG